MSRLSQPNTPLTRLWRAVPTYVLGAGILALGALPAKASPWQSPQSIADAARAFVEGQLPGTAGTTQVTASAVDPRLKLKACASDLEAFLPPGGSVRRSTSVGVRCRGPVAWKLYVPVTLETRVEVARLTRALPPGHRLSEADFEWVAHVQRTGSAALQRDLQSPVGRVLRTAAGAGQVLRTTMLEPAYVIRRGERVTLASGAAALAIRMQGEALANGTIGQKIRARNLSSGRVVEGVVRARGLLEIEVY